LVVGFIGVAFRHALPNIDGALDGIDDALGWNRNQVNGLNWVMSTHSAQDPRMSVRGRSSDIGFRAPLIFI
jgi:hypothetical protein